MKIAFRVDSGCYIGNGHLSRCITFANMLKKKFNAQCLFISREHQGHNLSLIKDAGFSYALLPLDHSPNYFSGDYHEWIGDEIEKDALSTANEIYKWSHSAIDLLVVDHYGLDKRWEALFVGKGIKVGIIDDLVNRHHTGTFLIDQTCSRDVTEYQGLVSANMHLFTGEKYCLLRPEFLSYRPMSLTKRRLFSKPKQIMVNFGSTDPHNHTARSLIGLQSFMKEHQGKVVVIVGSSCLHIDNIRQVISQLPYECELLIDVKHMAQLMVDIDLAVGAAGATTWERCMLGIPTLLLKTAENQSDVIRRVTDKGAAMTYIGEPNSDELSHTLSVLLSNYSDVSQAASQLISGDGLDDIINFIARKVK